MRARRRLKPLIGPNPSVLRLAISTAPAQSGSIPSWFAASDHVSSVAVNATGTAETSSNRASSSATAWRFVRPPTSTPAIVVPPASSRDEPAKTSPRSALTKPMASAAARGVERLRLRVRPLDA
jgi:hypothetical protein